MNKELLINSIPTKSNSDAAWISFYENLETSFSRKDTNALFTSAWKVRGSSNANTTKLREYLTPKGIILQTNLIQDATDQVSGFVDNMEDFMGVGKSIAIGLGLLLVAGVVTIGYVLVKNSGNIIEQTNKRTTEIGKAYLSSKTGGM